MADALGLSAVGWGPLAAGALAAGVRPLRRDPAALPPPLAQTAARVAGIAVEAGSSPVELALRWLLRRPARRNLIPLIGARTSAQLEASLNALDGDVDDAVIAALDAATAPRLGFPHDLISSTYLRRLALGGPAALTPPDRPRA